MGRRRKTRQTLALSRIYQRKRKFAYFSSEPIIDPRTKRATR